MNTRQTSAQRSDLNASFSPGPSPALSALPTCPEEVNQVNPLTGRSFSKDLPKLIAETTSQLELQMQQGRTGYVTSTLPNAEKVCTALHTAKREFNERKLGYVATVTEFPVDGEMKVILWLHYDNRLKQGLSMAADIFKSIFGLNNRGNESSPK